MSKVEPTVNIDGTLSISSGTFTANGPTDIDGTLSITSTGVYDGMVPLLQQVEI